MSAVEPLHAVLHLGDLSFLSVFATGVPLLPLLPHSVALLLIVTSLVDVNNIICHYANVHL